MVWDDWRSLIRNSSDKNSSVQGDNIILPLDYAFDMSFVKCFGRS